MIGHRRRNRTATRNRPSARFAAVLPIFGLLMGLPWGCGADRAMAASPPPASLAADPGAAWAAATPNRRSGAAVHLRRPPSAPRTTTAAVIAAVQTGLENLDGEVVAVVSAAESLPLHAVVLDPAEEYLAPYAVSLRYWSIFAFASLVAGAIATRALPASRFARHAAEPVRVPGDAAPHAPPSPPPATAPARPAQAQGADLAARARFVAMNFAIPEVITAPQGRWPLRLRCQPTRFALTLQHAALRYRLQFCNSGTEALGPLIVRADLAAVEVRVPQDRQADFDTEALPLCHYLDRLEAGAHVELTGELRLPLASVAAMRLGAAELLVPLMRLCVESVRDVQPILSVSNCFAIGIPPLAANSGIQPFRLDLAPRIWRELTAKRLACAKMPWMHELALDASHAQS